MEMFSEVVQLQVQGLLVSPESHFFFESGFFREVM